MKESNKENWTGRYGKKDKFWKLQDYKATAAELQEGEFWMAVEDFKDSFKYYSVAYLRSGWSNSFVEKRNAQNKKTYKFNFIVGTGVQSLAETESDFKLEDNLDVQLLGDGDGDGDGDNDDDDEDDDVQAATDIDEAKEQFEDE